MMTLNGINGTSLTVTVDLLHEGEGAAILEDYAREHAGQATEPYAVANTITDTTASFTFETKD